MVRCIFGILGEGICHLIYLEDGRRLFLGATYFIWYATRESNPEPTD